MKEQRLPADQGLYLEKYITIQQTPFAEVCRLLELDEPEPLESVLVGASVFLFDPDNDYLFNGAVIIDDEYGFYGISVGDNWLESAARLESLGFVQAEELERFTLPGRDFGVSIYLYHDNSTDPSISAVREYSICPRFGRTP